MNENHTIKLVEIPIGGRGGFTWNRLHAEREDICEALAKDCTDDRKVALQARLRKLDDALDRLMSGSSNSSVDNSDVILETLSPFDTILLRTQNSEYRILLLDPGTGRALVEGGDYLVEPSEALVRGSAAPGYEFKAGTISIGNRLEMWVQERALLTSPIKSVHLKQNADAESVINISAALH
jgi:hypothetical protein